MPAALVKSVRYTVVCVTSRIVPLQKALATQGVALGL